MSVQGRVVVVGEWICAGTAPMPVYIVATDFGFWHELAKADDALDVDEEAVLNDDGHTFYVPFHGLPANRPFWPDSEALDSLTAAKAAAESRLPSPVKWR